MGDILVPGQRGFHLAAPAALLEEDKEIAWEAAKERIVPRPDFGWIMSNYVDLSPPDDLRPNRNGHIFQIADGEAAYQMVRDTPLNWLHHDRFIVGHHADVELLYHLDGEPVADAETRPKGAHIETLAAFYRRIYPRQWQKVKDAHAEGLLHASMEAIPKTVTCQNDGCCGETFPFVGVWSETYCAAMQKPGRALLCNDPFFIGGAVVVPPHRPGWKDASAIEVATYIERHLEEAEKMFNSIQERSPGLTDQQAEAVLAALVEISGAAEGEERHVSMSVTGGRDLTFHLPDITLPTLEEVRQANAAGTIRQANALEDQANLQGVIVALVPPPEIAAQLAEMGDESPDQLHVTLAFLGDSQGDDELAGLDGPVTAERLNAMVAVFAASERPVPARLSGLGRFDLDDGNEVTYVSVDAPGLSELRARLVTYLRAGGVNIPMDHGFTPHITVQYHRAGEGPTELPEGLEWEVDSIELWWGSSGHLKHALGGVGDFDTMAAAVAIDALSAVDLLDETRPVDQMIAALNDFAAAARLDILQAALDAGSLSDQVADVVYVALCDRQFTTEQRKTLAGKGQAMPDGSFPTPTKVDWYNARAAVGRASSDDRSKVIAYLKRRAGALGIPDDDIPDGW